MNWVVENFEETTKILQNVLPCKTNYGLRLDGACLCRQLNGNRKIRFCGKFWHKVVVNETQKLPLNKICKFVHNVSYLTRFSCLEIFRTLKFKHRELLIDKTMDSRGANFLLYFIFFYFFVFTILSNFWVLLKNPKKGLTAKVHSFRNIISF